MKKNNKKDCEMVSNEIDIVIDKIQELRELASAIGKLLTNDENRTEIKAIADTISEKSEWMIENLNDLVEMVEL